MRCRATRGLPHIVVLAATLTTTGTAFLLRPTNLVHTTRSLGAPERLTSVLETTLVNLTGMMDRARTMLRAREARRTNHKT
jgi:hypothetical protein